LYVIEYTGMFDPGKILHWNGVFWEQHFQAPRALYDIWGDGNGNIYACGEQGLLCRYDGWTWSSSQIGVTQALRQVWGPAPDDVYVRVYADAPRHWDGTSWNLLPGVEHASLLVGQAADDIYIVDYDDLYHWNGAVWTLEDVGYDGWIHGFWTDPSTGFRYLFGDYGTVKRWDNYTPTPTPQPVPASSPASAGAAVLLISVVIAVVSRRPAAGDGHKP